MPVNPNLGGDPGEYSGFGGGSGGSGGGGGFGGSGGSGGGGGGGVGAPVAAPSAPSFSSANYQVVRDATDRSQYGPGVAVGQNDTVTITPLASNTVNAFYSVASGPDSAKSGPRITLTPTAVPRNVRVRNLNEIGVYSTVVGEGITIEHQKAS